MDRLSEEAHLYIHFLGRIIIICMYDWLFVGQFIFIILYIVYAFVIMDKNLLFFWIFREPIILLKKGICNIGQFETRRLDKIKRWFHVSSIYWDECIWSMLDHVVIVMLGHDNSDSIVYYSQFITLWEIEL